MIGFTPVRTNKKTVACSARFCKGSKDIYRRIYNQKKSLDKELQEKRESVFFNPNREKYVADINPDDLDLSNYDLNSLEINEVNKLNTNIWEQILKDCYRFRKSRSPERPLNPLNSVSQNVNLPNVEDDYLQFKTDQVTKTVINGEESIEIHISENFALTLTVNNDAILYESATDKKQSVGSIQPHINEFDTILVRDINKNTVKQISGSSSSTALDDMDSEIVLINENVDLERTPTDDLYMDAEIDTDIQVLQNCNSLPDSQTKEELINTLCRGYLKWNQRSEILSFLEFEDKKLVEFNSLMHPEYISILCDIMRCNIAHIPQIRSVLLSKETIPKKIQDLSSSFPDKNRLTEEDTENIRNFLNVPDFVNLTPDDRWRSNLKFHEQVARMYQSSEITHDDIVSLLIIPWDSIKYDQESIESAIHYGKEFRDTINTLDTKYNTNLEENIVKNKKEKIYRRD